MKTGAALKRGIAPRKGESSRRRDDARSNAPVNGTIACGAAMGGTRMSRSITEGARALTCASTTGA
jgi:hypothetical protein